MCGIIGYVGKENALPILLEGLKRESYRGYDSSGVALFGKRAGLVKAVGKLEKLEEKLLSHALEGGIGIGHCLSPSTLVQLADGRIKQIKNMKDGEEVSSVDLDNLTPTKGRVRVLKHISPEYLQEIRTSSTVLETTGEHRLFVWLGSGPKEKNTRDIVPGDILILPKIISNNEVGKGISFESIPANTYYEVASPLNLRIKRQIAVLGMSTPRIAALAGVAEHDLEHMLTNDRNVRTDVLERVLPILCIEFPSEGFIPRHSIHGNFVRLPQKSSPGLMQIIGYFLGDGYAGERTIRFKDMRKEVLERYQALSLEIFNLSGRVVSMNDTKAQLLEINSLPLTLWFKKNVKAGKEELLEKVGQLPKAELAAFLRGLFDAEGSVGIDAHQVCLGMTDERIVRTVQLLLVQFGILSSVTDKNTNRPAHWKRPYRLSISSQTSLKGFLAEICFTSFEKQQAVQALVNPAAHNISTSFKTLPFPKKIILGKCRSFLSGTVLRALLGHDRDLESFATEATIQKVISALKIRRVEGTVQIVQELESFLHGEVIFQEVVSNKKKKSSYAFLYDLEVTPQQNFFANGLLSHNSRWATHGGVTEENAHPHTDCKENIFLVHNGIIENYQALREKLKERGHQFRSETDTEVLPHLIEHFFRGNLEDAVRRALRLVRGTYGIAVIAKEDPDKIVAARLSSPLVLSINHSGGFVASDPAALISHSNKMVFLDDREVAVITKDNFFVTDLESKLKEKGETLLEWTVEEAQKGGYPHFMLKEIMEQPLSIENSFRGRLLLEEGKARLGGLQEVEEKLRGVLRLNIIACGTSYYAGLVGEYMLEEYAGIPTQVDIASEFRYRKAIVDKDTAFVFISQSGETADTLGALKEVKEKGGLTLGIVNVVGSSVARETQAGVYNHAGPEIGVASTKAFTSQLTILALLTLFLGRQRGMSLVMGQRIAKEIARVPELVKKVLETSKEAEKLAFTYKDFSDFLYIGRKYNYPVALEGALKLKEISYVHAEGYGAGEMKHGPLALIDKSFPTFAIAPSDSVYEKMISNIQEIKARGGPVIAIATEGNEDIKKLVDDVIYIPKTLEMLTPILSVIPLQLFAYFIGVLRGHDVDKPRNLAKSVTVE